MKWKYFPWANSPNTVGTTSNNTTHPTVLQPAPILQHKLNPIFHILEAQH